MINSGFFCKIVKCFLIQACNSLGITSCFQIGDTNCRSSDLIKSQVTEIYYFINTTEKTQIFDILIEIMKKLSEFPHISTQLSSKFLTLYQNDYAIVQDLQQKCSKKDPKVSSAIQTLKSKITNDIHDEIIQLENFVKVFCSSSANDKEKCKMIKEAAENLSKYNEYFQDSFHYVTSII
ncbi:hypothetical protein M9Y10_031403 [Tritrichomonas musculus]|uniref:Uncharacterized protein n=1 Tax=Tritrichomonas musculus TaxID=1915356 RepID=A0ABR2H0J9_9EUKA